MMDKCVAIESNIQEYLYYTSGKEIDVYGLAGIALSLIKEVQSPDWKALDQPNYMRVRNG